MCRYPCARMFCFCFVTRRSGGCGQAIPYSDNKCLVYCIALFLDFTSICDICLTLSLTWNKRSIIISNAAYLKKEMQELNLIHLVEREYHCFIIGKNSK